MIATPARDNLFLRGPPEDVVVIPDQLDVGLIRVRAGRAEIDLGHMIRCPIHDHLGQGDARLGAVTYIRMVVGQRMRLFCDSLCDLGPAIADIHAIKPSEGVEKPVAIAILYMTALTPCDDPLWDIPAREFRKMCGRMKEVLPIPMIELVVSQHDILIFLAPISTNIFYFHKLAHS